MIQIEGLNEQSAKRYIQASLKREYASENGNDLNEALPKMEPTESTISYKNKPFFKRSVVLLKNSRELVEIFKNYLIE